MGKMVENDLLFTTWEGHPIDPGSVSSWFPGFLREHGLPPVRFHSLRHTFASWHVEQGTPLYQVGALLGHRSPQMTQRYSHLSPDAIRKAALTLEGSLPVEGAQPLEG